MRASAGEAEGSSPKCRIHSAITTLMDLPSRITSSVCLCCLFCTHFDVDDRHRIHQNKLFSPSHLNETIFPTSPGSWSRPPPLNFYARNFSHHIYTNDSPLHSGLDSTPRQLAVYLGFTNLIYWCPVAVIIMHESIMADNYPTLNQVIRVLIRVATNIQKSNLITNQGFNKSIPDLHPLKT